MSLLLFVFSRKTKCTYGSLVRRSHPRSRCLHHTPKSDGYICHCHSGSPAVSRWGALQVNESRQQGCQQRKQTNKHTEQLREEDHKRKKLEQHGWDVLMSL